MTTTIRATELKLREVCNAKIALNIHGEARWGAYRKALLDYYAEPHVNRSEIGETLEEYARAGDLRSYLLIANTMGYLA